MHCNSKNEFIDVIKGYEKENIPVIIFGFTYVLFSNVIEVMVKEGKKFKLPKKFEGCSHWWLEKA